MTSEARWVRWLPWVSLAAFTTLWCARWPSFPLALDPFYHLFIARQFVDAGGPIAYEWWEYAPVGRPHLYPPLLHLLLAGFLKTGVPPLVVLRVMTALIVPAVLATVYVVMRRVVNGAAALATLWLAMLGFTWILQVAGAMASGLALIGVLWLMVAVVERRPLAISCLTALLFYTHLGLSWVALASVLWCAGLRVFRRGERVFTGLAWGLLLASPWLVYVLSHRSFLHVTAREENKTIDIVPLLYLLAAWGAWQCWKQRGRSRWLIGLWLGFCLMAYPYTFRWLSGEGVIPVILLAGYGAAHLAQRVATHWQTQLAPALESIPKLLQQVGPVAEHPMHPRRAALSASSAPGAWGPCSAPPTRSGLLGCSLGILALSLIVGMSPSLLTRRGTVRAVWRDSAPFHLLNCGGTARKAMDVSLYSPHMERLIRTVSALSQPGEILWSNAPYAGGLVAALSHHPLASAMFYEVPPAHPIDPVAAAHLIVWFKIKPLPGGMALDDVRRRYGLQVVADDPLALVFRNPRARELARSPQAIVPWWLAFVLSCLLIGLAVWDLQRLPTTNNKETWPA